MYARMHSIYSSHTCSHASNTQCHTHTHTELSGNPPTNRHKQCANFERNCAGWKSWARTHPANISIGPPRPAYFCHILARSPPRPADISPRGPQPSPHWSSPQPAPNIKFNTREPAGGGWALIAILFQFFWIITNYYEINFVYCYTHKLFKLSIYVFLLTLLGCFIICWIEA